MSSQPPLTAVCVCGPCRGDTLVRREGVRREGIEKVVKGEGEEEEGEEAKGVWNVK